MSDVNDWRVIVDEQAEIVRLGFMQEMKEMKTQCKKQETRTIHLVSFPFRLLRQKDLMSAHQICTKDFVIPQFSLCSGHEVT